MRPEIDKTGEDGKTTCDELMMMRRVRGPETK